ncbi:MAG TPA: MotA/TolQ/ExbB proton channel family protein [Thermoanaerobaculia bacterium]|jgi:biopolymer transport protein ExbB/biopolymer transport protein TolQ|nr:MotA/TolQ/ExbB proton channel family protein [Thermoanaerobaculia bacterium]
MNGSTALSDLAGKISATGFVVIAILVLLSVWSLGVSIERLFVLSRARRQSIAFAQAVSPHLAEGGRAQTAIEAARRFPHSHVARVVAAGLSTFQQKSAKGLTTAEVIEATGRALARTAMQTTEELSRGVASLGTIATTAPFIGLFGTVVGIVHAFKAIAGDDGRLETVSQGIAEALFTTALGLVVAVPAAWMFNFISQRVQHLGVEMESSSSELIDYFLERERG